MPIAVTEDHETLRLTVLRWAQTHCPPGVPRAAAEAAAPQLPAVWEQLGAQGWLGLHLPELHGGQGFTLAELAVVLEELGHALVPGPLLPTVLVSTAHRRPRGTRRSRPSCCRGWRTARSRRPSRRTATTCTGRRPTTTTGPCGSPARRARCSDCRRPGSCWCPPRSRRAQPRGASSIASSPPPPFRSSRCRRWTARAPSGAWTSAPGSPSTPATTSPACPTARCAGFSWPSPRRRARGSRAGVSRRPRTTPSSGSSSAGPSASSRRSSMRWPTCWWRWSRARRWPGTPPRRGARSARRSRGGTSARTSRVRSGWRRPPTAPSSASRSWAASGSPGSTTRTST